MTWLPPNTIKLACYTVILLGLVIGPAMIHGKLLNRWGEPQEFVEATRTVEELPAQLGSWVQTRDGDPLKKHVTRELGLSSYVSRYYAVPDGESVQLLLLTGQPGPLVRHPPEICYGMSGNARRGEPRTFQIDVDGTNHSFRLLRYKSSSFITGEFIVAYGFFDGHQWDAPTYPRLAYGGKPSLSKAQVLVSGDTDEVDGIPVPIRAFLHELILELRTTTQQ